jgi:DNA mismatch repair protein MutS
LRSQKPFSLGEARPRVLQQFQLKSLEGIGCEHLPLSVRAAGGLLEYLEDTQKENTTSLQRPRTYTLSDYLILDHQSRRNLEITTTVRDNTLYGSLLWALDKTNTPMGSRALRRWLLQPLLDLKGIRARHDTIQEFVNNHQLRQDFQQLLRQIYDLERLTGRVGNNTANAKDLVSLADSLAKLPQLAALAEQGKSPYLKALQNLPQSLEKIAEKMCHSPAILYRIEKRGFIREGYFADLTIVDLNSSWTVDKNNILFKCAWSPLEGTTFETKVTHTFVNGYLVYENGHFSETQKGQPLITSKQ